MKFYLTFIIILFIIGCNENPKADSGKKMSDIGSSVNKVNIDFHPLIDLILDNLHPDEKNRYNFEVLLDSTMIPKLTNFSPNLKTRLKDSVKIKLLQQFEKESNSFQLDTSTLSVESREVLTKKKDRENKVSIVFNSFLVNEKKDMAATSILFHYSPDGGWEELVIFGKDLQGDWIITDRIETINY